LLLFLSYADDDKEIAGEIAQRLQRGHVKVYPPQTGHDNNDLAFDGPEGAIGQADAFLALLSPSFLASSSCRRERELALHREQHGTVNGTGSGFVQVLQVRETAYHEAGALRSRPWLDLTSQRARETALNELVSQLGPADEPTATPGRITSGGSSGAGRLPKFRNREAELDQVLDGLTKEDGEHFWFLIAPPQLGKSRLLDRISEAVEVRQPGRWQVRLVDVRDQPAGVRQDPEALVRALFRSAHHPATDQENLRKLGIDISRTDKLHLCMLDSAELLDDSTVRELRTSISAINRHVESTRNRNARLTLIVASRREQEWIGVTPRPRLKLLPLTKFRVEVMFAALRELAESMNRDFSDAELLSHAELVHRLSEGLPALLYCYLNWIYEAQWNGLDRLKDREQFDRLTKSYIEEQLISATGLCRSGDAPNEEERRALARTFQAMAPYRIFTQSHLRHHAQPGGALHGVLEDLNWTVDKLWDEVGKTDWLTRPLPQPWQEVHPPIRRLLCHHWYTSEASCAQAYRDAREFVQSWARAQTGSDQSVALVECLWHEAQVLSLSRASDMEEKLIALARELSLHIVPSDTYSQANLRSYAVTLMTQDEELEEAVDGMNGLFERLLATVRTPA
jgi:hypothetical protein